MTSVAGETNAENLDERNLFERAQEKLGEAFSLLMTLEEQLKKEETRRRANASVHDQRAAERAELLAYVERVHAEALDLAAKPQASTRDVRERVRRVTMRVEEAARALQKELPAEASGKRAPRDTASNEDSLAAHLQRIVAAADSAMSQDATTPVGELARIYDDEVTPLHKRQTIMAEPILQRRSASNPASRTTSPVWTVSGDGAAPVAPSDEVIALPESDRLGPNTPRAVMIARGPTVRTVMFDPNIPRDAHDTPRGELDENRSTLIELAHLARERSGARLRRDRSPTEIDHSHRVPQVNRTTIAWAAAIACLVGAFVLLAIGLSS